MTESLRRLALRACAFALATLLLVALPVSSRADTYVLKNGKTVDGRTVREKDGVVYVKTLHGMQKVVLAEVDSKTEGLSTYDRYDELKKASEKNKKNASAQWALCAFLREHSDGHKDLDKEAAKLLKRVLKLAENHPEARDANGEANFRGKWVAKADLPRLEAEYERNRERLEWQGRFGVKVQLAKTDHFLLVDATDEKDLVGRGEHLDEAYSLLIELLGRKQLWSGRSPTVTFSDQEDYVKSFEYFQPQWQMSKGWIDAAKLLGGVWRDRPVPTQVRHPSSGAEGMWSATVHNVAHLAIWKMWGGQKKPPTWLEEGLGQWIEAEVLGEALNTCVGASKKVGKGGTTDEERGKKGKKGDSLQETQSEWKTRCVEAVQDGDFPPMRKFLRMQMPEYGPAEAGGALGMVTWLIGRDREKFTKLCGELKKGFAKDDIAWNDVYGYQLIEDMEKEWKAWVLGEW